jgi:uncharacterized protein YndB with AHSA1/START domain
VPDLDERAIAASEPGDETTVVATAAAAVPPEQVWHTLVARTSEWWAAPYLDPERPMHLEPRLGGRVWAGAEGEGELHGSVRAFDPPERLEIGGVLVPGAYAGSITVTVERTSLGSEIRVEHMARGRIDDAVEERISTGWTQLLARLTELAER